MNNFFTNADIQELTSNPSEYVKLNLVGKIANGYNGALLSADEQAVAADILRLLAQDISERIRINISEKFCRSEKIPYDIIKKLANDIEDLVAVPVVQFSTLLTEDDLLQIVRKDTGGKQRAVARRDNLSEKLVGALINHGSEHTIEALIDSNGDKLSEHNSQEIITKFSNNEGLLGALIDIKKINPETAQSLLSIVSEDLRQQIATSYKIPASVLDSIIFASKDSVSYSLLKAQISKANSPQLLAALVATLHKENQLNFNLITRILVSGNAEFFKLSLAKLAAIPTANVELLIAEDGNIGISKLFEKANLPKNLAEAAKILCHIVQKESALYPNSDITERVTKDLEKLVLTSNDNHLRYIANIIKQS